VTITLSLVISRLRALCSILVPCQLTALALGGFASAAFARVLGAKSGGGVGDDAHSWAVDGARQLKWPNGEEPYKCTWQAGDFIGLACDLDAMRELSAWSLSSPPTPCATAS
jgi:hypothetical protein